MPQHVGDTLAQGDSRIGVIGNAINLVEANAFLFQGCTNGTAREIVAAFDAVESFFLCSEADLAVLYQAGCCIMEIASDPKNVRVSVIHSTCRDCW